MISFHPPCPTKTLALFPSVEHIIRGASSKSRLTLFDEKSSARGPILVAQLERECYSRSLFRAICSPASAANERLGFAASSTDAPCRCSRFIKETNPSRVLIIVCAICRAEKCWPVTSRERARTLSELTDHSTPGDGKNSRQEILHYADTLQT